MPILQETESEIARNSPSVCRLFNLSLRTGCVPNRWKQSIVVPVPKCSPATTPDSYRPISLLSVLKALERHVYAIISGHLKLFTHWQNHSGDSY